MHTTSVKTHYVKRQCALRRLVLCASQTRIELVRRGGGLVQLAIAVLSHTGLSFHLFQQQAGHQCLDQSASMVVDRV